MNTRQAIVNELETIAARVRGLRPLVALMVETEAISIYASMDLEEVEQLLESCRHQVQPVV